MASLHIIFLAALFLSVFCTVFWLSRFLMPNRARTRLRRVLGEGEFRSLEAADSFVARVARHARPLANLSGAADPKKQGPLRIRFLNAGLRAPYIPAIYFGAKTLLVVMLPAIAWLTFLVSANDLTIDTKILFLSGLAATGFYLPNRILSHLVRVRQRKIVEGLPDALDLMTISVEAGLALDAAMNRVAEEIAASAPELSEELRLVTLELRAGSSKEAALRNFATRTGVEDVEALVAILVQAEQFGTSVGNSLRINSDTLRVKRRQRAEEAAAKIAVKMLFPLIFCIFPALFLVVLGPALIQIYRSLLPSMGS